MSSLRLESGIYSANVNKGFPIKLKSFKLIRFGQESILEQIIIFIVPPLMLMKDGINSTLQFTTFAATSHLGCPFLEM